MAMRWANGSRIPQKWHTCTMSMTGCSRPRTNGRTERGQDRAKRNPAGAGWGARGGVKIIKPLTEVPQRLRIPNYLDGQESQWRLNAF